MPAQVVISGLHRLWCPLHAQLDVAAPLRVVHTGKAEHLDTRVVMFDALRAEVESLRTQNAHLRALQAAQEPKPVREVDRNPDKVARTTIAGLPALSEDKDGRRRHAVKHARGYVLYDEDDRIVACEATDDVALGWCQFGWPYGAAWVLDGVLPTR